MIRTSKNITWWAICWPVFLCYIPAVRASRTLSFIANGAVGLLASAPLALLILWANLHFPGPVTSIRGLVLTLILVLLLTVWAPGSDPRKRDSAREENHQVHVE